MAHKYGAKAEIVDGHRFPSMAEAARYRELKLLERAGEIRDLELQPRFPIAINGVKCFTYIADFAYRATDRGGDFVYEDVKGCDTANSKLKRKIVEAAFPGLKIEIIKRRA